MTPRPHFDAPSNTQPNLLVDGLLLGAHGITMLKRVSLSVLALSLLLWIFQGGKWEFRLDNSGALLAALISITGYQLLLMGRVRHAVQTLLWGLWIVVTVNMVLVSGVRTPGLMVAPFLMMSAAWLAGLRTAKYMAITSLIAIAMMGFAEYFGFQTSGIIRPISTYILLLCGTILVTMAVLSGALHSYYDQLNRVVELTTSLQAQVQEVRLSEERFAALFRANPVPSSTINPNGTIIEVNDAWVALYGIAADKAIGKTSAELGIFTNLHQQQAVADELARRGRVDGAALTLITAGNVPKPFLLYLAPVEFGGQQRLVTSVLDQTDHLAAEASQRAVNDALESRVAERTAELSRALANLSAAQDELIQSEKLSSLGAMVAGVSHELNTPIGNTVTVVSTLQSRITDFKLVFNRGELKRSTLAEFVQDAEEMTDLIARSMRRSSELIASFKQVAVDRSSERRREFDLQELVNDIVTSLKPLLRKRNVTVEQDIPAKLLCDSLPGPAGQVLTNLIQNAVAHAFEDREQGTITLLARQEKTPLGDEVVLIVTDDGVGMSEHTRKHAFDPFFTTRLGQGGSGLGLSISHRIATSMLKGSLSVESQPGAGCCFTFRFLQRLPETDEHAH